MNGQAGKGDKPRPVDRKKWEANKAIPERRVKLWPRDSKGNLI